MNDTKISETAVEVAAFAVPASVPTLEHAKKVVRRVVALYLRHLHPAELSEQHGVDAVDELVESWTRQAKERFEKNEFSVVAESLIICARELKAALAATGKQPRCDACAGEGEVFASDLGHGVECHICGGTGKQQVGEVSEGEFRASASRQTASAESNATAEALIAHARAQFGEVQGEDAVGDQLLDELRDVEDYFNDVEPNPIHLATVQAAISALATRQSGAQGPKFTTEDGPCWHHAGKAFIVTVDGDTLQLMVTDGPRIEFIGDARPFRVPAQGIDLGQFIALAKFGEEFAFSAEKQPHSRVVYSQASRLLALIDQRDAAPGVGNG